MHQGGEQQPAGQRGRELPRGRNLGQSAQVWRTRFPARQESGPSSYQSSLFWRKQRTRLTLRGWSKVGEEFAFHRVDIQVAKVKTQSSNSGAHPGWWRWVGEEKRARRAVGGRGQQTGGGRGAVS